MMCCLIEMLRRMGGPLPPLVFERFRMVAGDGIEPPTRGF
jgi:hypothetical protein